VLRRARGPVQSAIFSSDGSHIVTDVRRQNGRIWDVHVSTLSPKGLIAEVCLRATRLTTLSDDENAASCLCEGSLRSTCARGSKSLHFEYW